MVLDQSTHGSGVARSSPAPHSPFSHRTHKHCPLDLVACQPRGQILLCFGGHCIALATQCRELTSCASTELPATMPAPGPAGSRSLQREGLPAHLHNVAGTVLRGQSGVSLGPPTSSALERTALLIDSTQLGHLPQQEGTGAYRAPGRDTPPGSGACRRFSSSTWVNLSPTRGKCFSRFYPFSLWELPTAFTINPYYCYLHGPCTHWFGLSLSLTAVTNLGAPLGPFGPRFSQAATVLLVTSTSLLPHQ